MRKGIMLAGCGVGLGAGLMYVFDPERGKRRRALLRDQTTHVINETLVTLEKNGRDIGNRARGLAAEARTHFGCQEVSNEVLVERVRSKMGRAVSKPHDIEVAVSEGRVTLRGIVFAREADRLLRSVEKVRGVREVESQLKIKRRRGEMAVRENGEENGERAAERRAPMSLLATVAGSGLALYGAKRRGAVGAIVSVVGMRMLGRGLQDSEPHLRGGAKDNRHVAV